jgi:hypothetical protein
MTALAQAAATQYRAISFKLLWNRHQMSVKFAYLAFKQP